MKNLTMNDISILKQFGYEDKDMYQIDNAISNTIYILCSTFDDQEISAETARKLLNSEDFLSAIGRSAFHWSACRSLNKCREIYFDSSKMFRMECSS